MYKVEKQPINNKVLKEIRDSLGLSQEQLAKKLGTDQSYLAKIEKGQVTPGWLIKFVALAQLLHQSGKSWEDVIIEFPDVSPRAAEDGGDYNV
jgi:transcriptional regulator with XRE-family HTH domain